MLVESLLQAYVQRGVVRNLSPAQLRILLVLLATIDPSTGVCPYNRGDIAALMGVAPDTVSKAMQGLYDMGLVEWQPSGVSGRYALVPLAGDQTSQRGKQAKEMTP